MAPKIWGAMKKVFKYKAFISYSHSDDRQAEKLHRKLERYRLPGELRQTHRLKPIFRDRDELSASHSLNDAIRDALENSENLIVICTPKAARSFWVNQEVLLFKKLGRSKNIFTVILDGEPFSNNPEHECLPEAVRFQIDQSGELTSKSAEPLAADFRSNGDGEKMGTLKLISALLGVGLDDIVRRDLQQIRKRFAISMIGAVSVTAVMGALTLQAISAEKKAEIAKQSAEIHRADAEDLIEFMLGDLRDRLEPVGRLDVLDVVGEKAFEYYEDFDDEELTVEDQGRRARTLHLIGEVQDKLGKTDESDRYFEESYNITAASISDNDTDRLLEHARSAFWRSVPLRRSGRHDEELKYLEEYKNIALRLRENNPESPIFMAELAKAETNIGRVYLKAGNNEKAHECFEAAAELLKLAVSKTNAASVALDRTENFAWLAESHRAAKRYDQAYAVRVKQVQTLQALTEENSEDFRFFEGLVYAQIGQGNAARYLKKYDDSRDMLELALSNARSALKREPSREKMHRAETSALLSLLTWALETNNMTAFKSYRSAINVPQHLSGHTYWSTSLPKVLSVLDAEFAALN